MRRRDLCGRLGIPTGPEKSLAVDRDGAVRSIAAVEAAGIRRYVMLSSMRVDLQSEGYEISHYYRAKGIADRHLARAGLREVEDRRPR